MDTGQPVTGPGAPTPGARHALTPRHHPPTGLTLRVTGTAPTTVLTHRCDAGTPGDAASREAPTQGPPQAHAESHARTTAPDTPKRATDRGPSPNGHTRDEESFDAFMESCRSGPQTDPAPTAPRSHPEPRGDHTGGTPLAMSRQAHLQRNYAASGARTEDTAATDDGHATARGAAGKTPDEPPRHSAQGSGTRVETGTNTTSEPAKQPPRATQAWGREHLDYARSEGNARHPNAHAEQAAAQDRTCGSTRSRQGSGSPWESASDGCLLRIHATSRREDAPWLTSPLAVGQNRTHPTPPWSTPASGTTWPPGSWRILGPIARIK